MAQIQVEKNHVEEVMNSIVSEILKRLDDDFVEEFEERAAIMEFDGGLTRDHAECLALLDVISRHPMALLAVKVRKNDHLI